jgi:hypothetical protein
MIEMCQSDAEFDLFVLLVDYQLYNVLITTPPNQNSKFFKSFAKNRKKLNFYHFLENQKITFFAFFFFFYPWFLLRKCTVHVCLSKKTSFFGW